MRILCYGDSNTWGYVPCVGTRYEKNQRWTGILEKLTGAEVIEEGLPGRTTVFFDNIEPFRCGLDYAAPCVLSHLPLDYVVLQLGINDTKRRFNVSAKEIRFGMEEVIFRMRDNLNRTKSMPKFIIIAPSEIYPKDMYEFDVSSVEKVRELGNEYRDLAKSFEYMYIEGVLDTSCVGVDGIHLTLEGHTKLAKAISKIVK